MPVYPGRSETVQSTGFFSGDLMDVKTDGKAVFLRLIGNLAAPTAGWGRFFAGFLASMTFQPEFGRPFTWRRIINISSQVWIFVTTSPDVAANTMRSRNAHSD